MDSNFNLVLIGLLLLVSLIPYLRAGLRQSKQQKAKRKRPAIEYHISDDDHLIF